jgi:[ribosomal protein S5]-alanine N-acetyltransferase
MKKHIILDCDSFILRRWMKKDLKSLIYYANNRNVWINLKDVFPYPYTKEDADKWFRIIESTAANTNFAIVAENKAVGGIGLHLFTDVYKHSAEIGYWLGEEYWGKGIATSAVARLTSFAFENFDINRIFARVFEWNPASVKVLEKNGFQLEGKLRKQIFKNGVFTDELIFGLLKNE